MTFEALEKIGLPRMNKGITLRGAFGTVFRGLVCHDRKAECRSCQLHRQCPYGFIFSPTVPAGAKRLRLNTDIPRPFVLKPPLDGRDVYERGDLLCFDLVVVGSARDFLPYFIVTFEELGRRGVGIRRGRYVMRKLEAMRARGEWDAVFASQDRMVRPPEKTLSLKDIAKDEDQDIRSVELEFMTPVLLKEKGRWVRPAFGPLLKRLRDRIGALSYFYCGAPLDMDFSRFGKEAESVRTEEHDLEWVEEGRFSKHRGLKHLLKGYIGKVVFEGELSAFMPFLRLGEYLHAGKATAFGQGWYRIVSVGGTEAAEGFSQTSRDLTQKNGFRKI
jgi:hypothetical protein